MIRVCGFWLLLIVLCSSTCQIMDVAYTCCCIIKCSFGFLPQVIDIMNDKVGMPFMAVVKRENKWYCDFYCDSGGSKSSTVIELRLLLLRLRLL